MTGLSELVDQQPVIITEMFAFFLYIWNVCVLFLLSLLLFYYAIEKEIEGERHGETDERQTEINYERQKREKE